MKLIKFLIITLIVTCLVGCREKGETAYERLKKRTNASDEELEKIIVFSDRFHDSLKLSLEDGTLEAAEITENFKKAEKAFESIQRSDELTAIMTLVYLRALEEEGEEKASELMAKQLNRFLKAEFPSAESSIKIRETIQEYSAKSRAMTAQEKEEEKDDADQPATAPESKPSDDVNPNPESKPLPK